MIAYNLIIQFQHCLNCIVLTNDEPLHMQARVSAHTIECSVASTTPMHFTNGTTATCMCPSTRYELETSVAKDRLPKGKQSTMLDNIVVPRLVGSTESDLLSLACNTVQPP